MTKAQQVYERVEALVSEGNSKADAFRQIAEETGQPFNSARGAYYQHTRKLDGGAPRKKPVRETTPADAVESAKGVLRRAIESIDDEIEAAKERAEEAKREFEALKGSAIERKSALTAKIDALEA